MNEDEVKLLREALRWFNEHGAHRAGHAYTFSGKGCGCCSDQADPPAHLVETIERALTESS